MIRNIVRLLAQEQEITNPTFTLYPGGRRSFNSICVFEDGELQVVAKYSHLNERSIQELSDSLAFVADALASTQFANTTPKPLPVRTHFPREVMVQTPVDGIPSHNYLRRIGRKNQVRQLLRQVTRWLAAFHSVCSNTNKLEDMPVYLPGDLSSNLDEDFFGPMHGDFVTSNVLIDDENVSVIDWEEFDMMGIPIVDLIFFFVSLASIFHSRSPFEYTVYDENWFSKSVRLNLKMYCSYMDTSMKFIRQNIPLYLHYSKYLACNMDNLDWAEHVDALNSRHRPELVVW